MSKPDRRLALTHDEYSVLIHMFNQMADHGIARKHRVFPDGSRRTLEVKPFLRKLLKIGLKSGWIFIPKNCPISNKG